jgi:predicted DNA-binding ribbon-helix-helix protein
MSKELATLTPFQRRSTIKKSFDLSGHYTSISLEKEFWDALQDLAKDSNQSVRGIVLHIDQARLQEMGDRPSSSLSSRIRVYILQYYRQKTPSIPE